MAITEGGGTPTDNSKYRILGYWLRKTLALLEKDKLGISLLVLTEYFVLVCEVNYGRPLVTAPAPHAYKLQF